MKQVVQNVRSGELRLLDVPAPLVAPGQLLIANQRSLISAGTEKMVMTLAKKSLLGKALERPDHVRRVVEKVRQEGLLSAWRQVSAKLDEPLSMGYASAGVVLSVGSGVEQYKIGDRVASNGPHAGIVSVPQHLCARIPDSVSFDEAAFTVLGAIALQGVRLAHVSLGETVLVIGLGLVGQLTVALLRSAGVTVLGTDPDPSKCELAIRLGARLARPSVRASDVEAMTLGLGADAVCITASTASNAPIELASAAVRKKGRVVLVGVVGLELDRRPFYFKEAEFVVSCSYGPGRYDPRYEDQGVDYPAAYVRWTEQRNLQAVLELMGNRSLDVAPLISHRYSIDEADRAYDMINQGSEAYLGVLLEYPPVTAEAPARTLELKRESSQSAASDRLSVGVLGAGSFARATLLPALTATERFTPTIICSSGGLSAAETGKRMGFLRATTDENEVLQSADTSAVLIVTRHDLHADQVIRALDAGKHVFVEKPLCLTLDQLFDIETALHRNPASILLVGFNRRFSPAARQVRDFFETTTAPLTVTIRFNAGAIPADHWLQDPAVGGGRIIGEACHAIDLATFLVNSPPVRVFAESVGGATPSAVTDDQCLITMRHANGSISSIHYTGAGDKAFPKERVEVFGGNRVGVIEDFRQITLVAGGKSTTRKYPQDKGHRAELEEFYQGIRRAEMPIPWEQLRAVSAASILAVQSLREGAPLWIQRPWPAAAETENVQLSACNI